MARPINADAAATRRRILDSAQARFAAQGLDGSSVRAIAKDAGVSLAMVHHYFGNKSGLYEACVEAMYTELGKVREALLARLAGASSVAEILDEAVRSGFRFARAHQQEMRLLLRSVMEAGELDASRREHYQLPFLAEGSQAVAAATGRPAEAFRLPLQSITFLIARYAVSTERELAAITGAGDGANDDDVLDRVEAHLVRAARALLDLPADEEVTA